VILEAATEFKSAEGVRNANHWRDYECKREIQEKNTTEKCLIRKRTNLEIYQQKRIIANGICIRKKKEWIERKIK
jgi:hypothetical protein